MLNKSIIVTDWIYVAFGPQENVFQAISCKNIKYLIKLVPLVS